MGRWGASLVVALLAVLLRVHPASSQQELMPRAKPGSRPQAAQAAFSPAERLFTPDDVAKLAAAYLDHIPTSKARTARFISFHAIPLALRPTKHKLLNLVLNCLSGVNPDLVPAVLLPHCDGVLAYVDLEAYHINPDAWDRLGLIGSGSAPFPDPIFHHIEDRFADEEVVEEVPYGYWHDGRHNGTDWKGQKITSTTPGAVWHTTRTEHRKVQRPGTTLKRQVLHAPWISKAATAALVSVLHTDVPLLEFAWFIQYSTIEPRYHELLGLDDTLASAKKLAAVDEDLADRLGSQLRGIPLFSEVATRIRVLERSPTPRRYGRGSWNESLDFKTSIRKQDALGDLLVAKPDAREIIFSLANGLHGYFVVDGNGKRLDFADPEIAQDSQTRLKDHLVRTGRSCMGCHWPQSGYLLVKDEVREFSRKTVTLAVERLSHSNPERSQRIKTKYLDVDLNELLNSDQLVFAIAVKAATGGPDGWDVLTANTELQETIRAYADDPVDLPLLARLCGESEERVLAALTQGGYVTDHALVGLGTGRKQRRDQIEASLGQVLLQLYKTRTGGKD